MNKETGGAAFPGEQGHVPEHGWNQTFESGMTLRDYFIAHAPAEPQGWFKPVMETARPKPVMSNAPMSSPDWDQFPKNSDDINAWDDERRKQTYIQWPAAWADEMIKQRSQSCPKT